MFDVVIYCKVTELYKSMNAIQDCSMTILTSIMHSCVWHYSSVKFIILFPHLLFEYEAASNMLFVYLYS